VSGLWLVSRTLPGMEQESQDVPDEVDTYLAYALVVRRAQERAGRDGRFVSWWREALAVESVGEE
jgi:hypothetical protein